MSLRTFASFRANFPIDGDVPGKELADFVAAALAKSGIVHNGVNERDGWAWEIKSIAGETAIECIVGYSDDGPRQWQIHTYGHLGLLNRLFGLGMGERDASLKAFCEAIDGAIKSDDRFRDIRWYEEGQFGKDYGATWADSPAG